MNNNIINNNNNNNKETEQTKKSENLLNNLLNKLEKSYIIRSFSVSRENLPVYLAFCEIAKRENPGYGGFSETLVKAMGEYVRRHGVGNPQLLLTHYIKTPEEQPQPIRVLCLYCNGAISDGRIYCVKRGMWIPSVTCYSCKENRLRKVK
jgi:hypothetical protein